MINFLIICAALVVGLTVGWFGWIALAVILGLGGFAIVVVRPRLLFFALIILIALGQFGRIPPGSASGTVLVTDVVAGLLFFLWYLWALSRPSPAANSASAAPVLPAAVVAWIGFLGVALIGLLFNPLHLGKQELAMNGFYYFRLLCYSSLAWIVPVLLPGAKGASTLWRWLIGLFTAVTVLGFVQLYLLPNIGGLAKYGWDPHVGRLVSSFLDPNYLGGFFAIAIAVVGASLTLSESSSRSRKLLALLAIILAATVLTYSRSGYLAVGIVVLILGLRYSWKLLAVALVCVIPLGLAIPRVAQRIEGGLSLDKTSQDRIDSWTIAGGIISYYPVMGIGYNDYRSAQEQLGQLSAGSQSRSGAGSDSSLLNVMATTGITGLCLFLLTLVLVGRQAFRTIRVGAGAAGSERGRLAWISAFAFLIAAPATLLHSWFVNALFYPFTLLVIILLIGGIYMRAEPRPLPKL